ncbi:hypothetical protein GLAREA_09812 [Glarea lozoyensis ATCC 20868]|uniref:Uncharacterized protein n=1 Tax=Glarea lozoyensis (strain ATCC 20868 / MF5171) TaxID=1116229 RepID=S3D9M7_GLAL2|nr:uncharacterized protein GLAREA_09812 [Glarea lozoyensis ATCC 20868]EPE28691.1 hypothetical protein GLAREA_09812 [Glarea lozoyensis ATCC 20868]
MDEASRLVSELHSKLAALDDKVARYQRDMASEFTKYAADLLRNVPKDVSDDVSRRIAESVREYPSLKLDPGTIESCADATGCSNSGGVDSPNGDLIVTEHVERAQEDEEDPPRSPHEREKEFQGLFTPFYLPLLDSNDRNERRSSSDLKAAVPVPITDTNTMDNAGVDASTDTRSLAGTPEPPRPPLPKRRNTDEVSSGSSDLGDGITRRSALRRSSTSSTRNSPRRVRFEVEGEEVLPTSSPYTSELQMTQDLPVTYQILGEDLEDVGESEQIEDIEDIDEEQDLDEEPPPTRRVSSSQALRALSRGPFVDDGTQWTTVSAPPDGSASIAVSGDSPALSTQSSTDDLPIINGISRAPPEENILSSDSPTSVFTSQNTTANSRLAQPQAMPSSDDILARHESDDPEYMSDEEEDDMLDMPALTSMKGKRSNAPQPSSLSSSGATPTRSPTAATMTRGVGSMNLLDIDQKKATDELGKLRFSADDEDEMFTFDDNDHRPSPPEEEDDDSEPESSSPISPTSPGSGDDVREASGLSKSPARPIVKPASRREMGSSGSGATGSLRGHPFQMPIVSPDVHAAAASMGDFNSFVGSVHGRSGVDDCDPMAFRNSIGKPTYQGNVRPLTMQDRLAHDEYHKGKQADTPIESPKNK